MNLAIIGLGKMGANMAQRLLQHGIGLVVKDNHEENMERACGFGAKSATSLEELVTVMDAPRAVWVMVPAGKPTADTVEELGALLSPGDVVIDGGNSNFRQSMARGAQLAEKGIGFIDAGVSGGVWGLTEGYALMVGGAGEDIETVRPAFEALAPAGGFMHCGPVGSGHFVKMVHNGIEYGLMQAYAEGFELMHASPDFDLDLHAISEGWRHGSVVRSWLLDLTERALADPDEFAHIKGYVNDSGEGRWTVEEAINTSVPLPVITASLYARFSSRQDDSYAAKLTAALRNQFGGHAVTKSLTPRGRAE